MAYTAPTGDVCMQEGTFLFSYICSGTVTKGQPVVAADAFKAKAATAATAKSFIGVAEYGKTDGDMIAIAGPGNIVRVTTSGTACAAGDILMPTADGWKDSDGAPSGHAIALETVGTDSTTIRVLLI